MPGLLTRAVLADGQAGGGVHERTGEFPKGVGHRVENGWGLTKVAVVLLNGVLW